jgi:ABC-type Zn uptake system ZnuABC Zn-binding protein ZnuA
MLRSSFIVLVVSWVWILSLPGCASLSSDTRLPSQAHLWSVDDLSAVELNPGETLSVVASIGLVGEVVGGVGGDAVTLSVLIPSDADPHTYQPSAADFRILISADAIFISGAGLEEALEPTLEEVSANVPVISLSDGLISATLKPQDEAADDHDASEDHNEVGDPHYWMNPQNVFDWTQTIETSLSRLDPNHADEFQSRAAAYRTQLQDLDAWIEAHLSPLTEEQRILLSDHRALTHFAARYGFQAIGELVPSTSTAAEPSAGHLAELENRIQEYGVSTIFVGANSDQRLANRLAEDTGLTVVPLYIGSLSTPDGPASTYFDMMRYNVQQIFGALSGR